MSQRLGGYAWFQWLGLIVILLLAVGLSFLAMNREVAEDLGLAAEPADSGPASAPNAPDADPTSSASDPSGLPEDGEAPEPPVVKDKRRADLTDGGTLPDGAELIDVGDNKPGLALTKDGLTHGAPTVNGVGMGVLEVRLNQPVRSLGFQVLFSGPESGSASLMTYGSSYADAVTDGTPAPVGLSLAVRADGWTLIAGEGEGSILASGRTPLADGAVDYRVIFDDVGVFVLDPTGETTFVEVDGVADPDRQFAAWSLSEADATEAPALIQLVSAG